eukprot:2273610-Rhodomonas_salina.1
MELPPRLYFTTAVWMQGPHEVTDFRRFIPTDMRYPDAVIEAEVQLWDAGYLRQAIQGSVIALTRGKPGSRDDPAPWLTLHTIPDGHAGLYPDNLVTYDTDKSLRCGFPLTLETGDEEEPLTEATARNVQRCWDRLEDLLTRRKDGIWVPAEIYLATKIPNVLTATLRQPGCNVRVWLR